MSLKAILNFLKTHWISLTSGAVSLLAIAALVLGMTSKAVVEEMQKIVSGAGEIQSLKSAPKNQGMIDAEKERLEKFKEEYEAAIKVAASINERKVLMDGVFPGARSDEFRYRFQEAYRMRLARLPAEMNAGGPPNAQELQDAADEIADERRRRGGDLEPTQGGPPKPPEPPPGGVRPEDRLPGGSAPPPQPPPPTGDKSAATQDEAARRAAIRKALSIQLYAEAFGTRNAFQISSIATMTEPPAADDMWYAQIGLWIQEDVVRAIRETNEEAATKFDPKEANVGRMPIKHLLLVRVPGYVTSTGGLVKLEGVRDASTTPGPATPFSGEIKPAFTNRVGDENFDVVRLTVTAIVDQRDLLKLPDRLTRINFYQLVDLDYTAVLPTGADAQAFHYGDGPVVLATYEFEGFLARKVYLDLMPEAVQIALGIKPKGN